MFSKKLIKFFNILFIIFFFWIYISSIVFRSNVYYNQNRIISLLFSPVVLLIWFLIYNKILKKNNISFKLELIVILIFFTIVLFFQFIIIKQFCVYPSWDYGVVFDNAIKYVQNGSRSNAVYIEYFQYFPNNIMLFFISIYIIKIGSFLGLSAIKSMIIFNIFMIDVSILILYLVCRKKYDVKSAIFSLVISCFFIALYLYTPIFYTDTLSLFIGISFIFIYLFVENNTFNKKNKLLFAAMGIMMFFGKTIKITSLIVLIAILINYIFNNKIKYIFCNFSIMILTFIILNTTFTNVVIKNEKYNFEINKYGSYPITHWIMMGIEDPNADNSDRNAYGGYNEKDYDLTRNFEKGSDAVKFNIKESIRRIYSYDNFGYAKYLSKKVANAWGDGLYYSDVALNINPINNNTLLRNIFLKNKTGNSILVYTSQSIQFAFLFILTFGILFDKSKKNKIDYIRLSIFGLAFFLLFWENRSRYIYNFIPIFILCIVDFYSKYEFKGSDSMKKIFDKYKEIIMYGIFGVLTTVVNIVFFYLFDKLNINTYLNNTISWIISVLFAFFTNKYFVFESKSNNIEILIKEGISFFGARLLSYFIDMITIFILFEKIGMDKIISKIISNIIVIIINYIISKLFIFKKKDDKYVEC